MGGVLSYDLNGGSGSVTSAGYVNQGTYILLPANPTHSNGYSFIGWNDQQSPNRIYTANFNFPYIIGITLKAVWINNSNFAIPSGTPIKFSQIQKVFGGTNPIKISEYYNNGNAGYVGGIANIPSIPNSINISVFYKKIGLPVIKSAGVSQSLISLDTGANYYIFTSTTGENSIIFNQNTVCEILIVGGGGGGAHSIFGGGGGGGGGGYVNYINYYFFNPGKYIITVGSGGIKGELFINGSTGGTSSITSNNINISAPGGTGGIADNSLKGGNSGIIINNINTTLFNGGTGYYTTTTGIFSGGGGAGAGGIGYNASSSAPGVNGVGYLSSIININTYYASGGAGGYNGANRLYNTNNQIGGGGNGGNNSTTLQADNGNNGCVIIKFKKYTNFTNMTFTPAGATGNTGPELNTLISNYSGIYPLYTSWISEDLSYFKSINGKQILLIQKTGTYKITAVGAGAVSGKKGYGHYITCKLTSNEYLTLIVGQKGTNGHGGGGSFVFISLDITNLNNLLICAGGAGGNGYNGSMYATIGYNGGNGTGSGGTGGAPNNNGNKGNDGVFGPGYGFNYGGTCGSSWINAGLFGSSIGSFGGGGIQYQPTQSQYGTYFGKPGGGGGGGYNGGGGGGGGGDGDLTTTSGGGGGGGGGGGSFPTSGTIEVTTTAEADGYISIEFLS